MAFSDERAAAAIYLLFDEEDDARHKEWRWWRIEKKKVVQLQISICIQSVLSVTCIMYVMCTDSVSDCIIVCVVYCVSTIVKKNQIQSLAFIGFGLDLERLYWDCEYRSLRLIVMVILIVLITLELIVIESGTDWVTVSVSQWLTQSQSHSHLTCSHSDRTPSRIMNDSVAECPAWSITQGLWLILHIWKQCSVCVSVAVNRTCVNPQVG